MSCEYPGKDKIYIYMLSFIFIFVVIKQLTKHGNKTSADGDYTIWGKAKLR